MSKKGVTKDGVWYAPSLFDDDENKQSDMVNELVPVTEPVEDAESKVEIIKEESDVMEKKNDSTLSYKIFIVILAVIGTILLVTFGFAALLVLPLLGISLFTKNKFMRL